MRNCFLTTAYPPMHIGRDLPGTLQWMQRRIRGAGHETLQISALLGFCFILQPAHPNLYMTLASAAATNSPPSSCWSSRSCSSFMACVAPGRTKWQFNYKQAHVKGFAHFSGVFRQNV